jgi:tetratricopeptide (TPR) repeat protein
MHCFVHTDRDPVGICKSCYKGLCAECAADLHHSLACKGTHEEAVERLVLASQAKCDAALKDFDTALRFDSTFVPALRQRGKIYADRGNFTGALADYSAAIRLQPKAAALWSDRGEVNLSLHRYRSAITDEAQAIQFDPKLASAYYLRSVAFGDLGHRDEAVSDLRAAVALNPSLAAYVTITGKTVVLKLPPL